MSDLNHQNIATVQSNQQPMPVTMAAATTIAPTTFLTFLSGTADVGTITPPVTGSHLLCLVFTDADPGDLLTTGNVAVGTTTIEQNVPVLVVYNPLAEEYHVMRGGV